MHSNAPTISAHRLQRFHRWAMLWLKWFVVFLDAAGAPLAPQALAIAHGWLNTIEEIVLSIALRRAAPLMRAANAPKHAQHRRIESNRRRAIIGGAMRRALRAKDLRQRLAALSQDIDGLVARFLKRLPRGLTRRRPIIARPEQRPKLVTHTYDKAGDPTAPYFAIGVCHQFLTPRNNRDRFAPPRDSQPKHLTLTPDSWRADTMADTATRKPKPLRAAIVYDFDGTLARGNLQERSFIPDLGMDHDAFWMEVKRLARAENADEVLVYMQQMLMRARLAGKPLTRAMLSVHGADPLLFDGLDHWFDRIDAFGADLGLQLDHYVVSSGIEEMIEGCAIYPKFRQVFASRFMYDERGEAIWPAVAINYTTKTQFLFRINKGIENVWDTQAINRWMREDQRPLPFERMIFIGDGDTDIPSMRMVTSAGGCAVAVLDPDRWNDPLKVDHIHKLIAEDRVNFVAPADYMPSSQLDVIIKGALGRIALRAGLSVMA